MTTKDPTPSEFDEIMNAGQVSLEASPDKGLVVFETNRSAAQDELNANGGIMNPLYPDVVEQMNKDWEFHEQIATVNGRVYLRNAQDYLDETQDPSVTWIIQQWGEPQQDERGVFWLVTDARLESYGIIDIARDLGETTDVCLSYAFGFENDSEDYPTVIIYSDSAVVDYDFDTDLQVGVWLEQNYPEIFTAINEGIELNPHDYTDSIREIARIVEGAAKLLANDTKLGVYISRYATNRLQFNKRLPCVIEIKPSGIFEMQDEDGTWVKANFPEGSSEIICDPQLDVSGRHAGVMLGFPETDGENAVPGFLPFEVIQRLYDTAPSVTVFERAVQGMAPQMHTDYTSLGVGEAVIAAHETEPSAAREWFEALSLAQDGLNEMYALAINFARGATYDTPEQAQDASGAVAEEMSKRLMQTGADRHLLFVNGPECLVHPSLVLDDPLEDGTIQIRTIEAGRKHEKFETSKVLFRNIASMPVEISEDSEEWTVLFYIRGLNESSNTHVHSINGVPVTDMIINEHIAIPLDGTSELSIAGYQRAKEVFGLIDALDNGGTISGSLLSLYDSIIQADGDSLSKTGIHCLQTLGKYYNTSANKDTKEKLQQALALMLCPSKTTVRTVASPPDVNITGRVLDVSKADASEVLTITLEDDDGSLHIIPLDSLEAIAVS